jgi:SNF2 family DNA or RNA helicase
MGFEPFTKETWITKSDNPSGDFPLAPSAKTTALKSILLKGFVEAPLDKVSLLLVVPISISSIGSLYVEIVKFNIQISWNIENSHSLTIIQVVIYVQFRALARIVGRICASEGWGFLYLTGDLSLDNRTKAIRKFREDPEIKILIAGLKCGGLGYVCSPLLSKYPCFNVPNRNRNILPIVPNPNFYI